MDMHRRTILGTSLAMLAGAALALAAPLSASAHVSASASSTAAGSYAIVTISVPHGVEEESTSIVTIEIPESLAGVTPTVNPNWTITNTLDVVEFRTTQTSQAGATVGWEGDDVPSVVLTADGVNAEGVAAISAPIGGADTLGRVLGGVGLLLGAIALAVSVITRRAALAHAGSDSPTSSSSDSRE